MHDKRKSAASRGTIPTQSSRSQIQAKPLISKSWGERHRVTPVLGLLGAVKFFVSQNEIFSCLQGDRFTLLNERFVAQLLLISTMTIFEHLSILTSPSVSLFLNTVTQIIFKSNLYCPVQVEVKK